MGERELEGKSKTEFEKKVILLKCFTDIEEQSNNNLSSRSLLLLSPRGTNMNLALLSDLFQWF